jgi:hypothetical protein
LCYIFQVEDEEADKRLVYKLTGRQQIAIQEVQGIIQEFEDWKEEQLVVETSDPAREGEESDEEIEFIGWI